MKELLGGLVISSLLMSSAQAFSWGNDCEYSRDLDRELSLNSIRHIYVEAGAGSLEIRGDDSLDSVMIDAKLCAEEEAQLAEMDVLSELKGKALYIETDLARGDFWNRNSDGAYIDLIVRVPADSQMDVKDSSGAAEIRDVASLLMVDSSGELIIEDIAGDVRVTDSSGAVSIEQIAGNVSVTDSSGSIAVYEVTGDFTVEVDSSGGIEAEQIGGNVLVKTDSSGSIDVNQVAGNFTVRQDSSGGIYHKNVGGRVSLPD